mmetsp:Transcript_13711/g.37020  ORF Transcript_13711/g.37020 Transcript_13711/m.37020 type:complete len:305 (-) Transcript_13711:491-1405(-)
MDVAVQGPARSTHRLPQRDACHLDVLYCLGAWAAGAHEHRRLQERGVHRQDAFLRRCSQHTPSVIPVVGRAARSGHVFLHWWFLALVCWEVATHARGFGDGAAVRAPLAALRLRHDGVRSDLALPRVRPVLSTYAERDILGMQQQYMVERAPLHQRCVSVVHRRWRLYGLVVVPRSGYGIRPRRTDSVELVEADGAGRLGRRWPCHGRINCGDNPTVLVLRPSVQRHQPLVCGLRPLPLLAGLCPAPRIYHRIGDAMGLGLDGEARAAERHAAPDTRREGFGYRHVRPRLGRRSRLHLPPFLEQ